MTLSAKDHNTSISNFLDRYCSMTANPKYAVMLRGPWGSGKTKFIEHYQNRLREDGKKTLYASFFGVSKKSDIIDQFFSQMHPILGSKAAKNTSTILRGLIKASLKIDIDRDGINDGSIQLSIPDIEKWGASSGSILFFDDLDRSNLSIEESLAIINQFVEHDGYRAIAIANEEAESLKIESGFSRIKEKTFGRTFEIAPDSLSALDQFLVEVSDRSAHAIINDRKNLALDVFERAAHKNLRQLRQSILDFADLWDNLNVKPDSSNSSFIDRLVKDTLSISIEYRHGSITSQDIRTIEEVDWSAILSKDEDQTANTNKSSKDLAFERHGFSRGNPLAIPSIAFSYFFQLGNLSEEAASDAIKNSAYLEHQNVTAWRRLWYLFSHTDSEFESLALSTLTSLKSSNFSQIAELIHVTAILLNLARIGLVKESVQDIQRFAIQATKRSIKSESLTPISQHELNYILSDGAAFGLGFTNKGSAAFIKSINDISEIVFSARLSWIKYKSKDWLLLIESKTDEWAQELARPIDLQGIFYDDPVFIHIDARKFAKIILNLPANKQQIVSEALTNRYDHPNLYAEWLRLEIPFIEKLIESVEFKIAKTPQSKCLLSTYYLRTKFLPNLKKSLSSLKQFPFRVETKE